MNVEKYKSDYLDRRMQLILFYKETGKIIYSTESLFTVLTNENIYGFDTFIESISPVLQNLQLDQPLTFSCVNTVIEGKSLFLDYQFEVPSENEADIIVMQVFNFSDHYENLTRMQQERNELEIQQEVQKVEREKVLIQNELLTYKNEELIRLQKLKTDFFARVSHEIRNPVSGIAGLSELLGRHYEDKEKAAGYLEALSSTSQHLVNLVNNVLDFSKLETFGEQHEIEKIHFDVFSLVESIVNSFLFAAKEQAVGLTKEVADDVPKNVLGDKYKLTQVLTNLVGNALKFTDNGGSVKLKVDVASSYSDLAEIVFKIMDTGIGIPDNFLGQLFDPYSQADTSIKRTYGGSGLGLPIVKKLVNLMNGTITVSSREGEGSTFVVKIPFEISDKTIPIQQGDRSEGILSFDGKILIGEDDLINQKVIAGILESEGVNFDIAGDGDEVLTQFRHEDYDLLILDINMPVKNGLEVSEEIRKIDTIPIIICSGQPYDVLEKQLDKLDNIFYIAKPISYSTLIDIIKKAINKPSKRIIDFEVFENLFGDNRDRINEIISIFVEEAPENIEKMKRYFEYQDYDRLKRLAHKVKSGFAYFGMKETCRLCDQLEQDLEKNLEKNYLPQIEKIEEDTLSAIKELNQS